MNLGTMAEDRPVEDAVRMLVEFAWMARRSAAAPVPGTEESVRPSTLAHDEATWMLHQVATARHIPLGHPDQTANRDYDAATESLVETPSFFADGSPVDFTPTPERAAELHAQYRDDPATVVQWMVDVLHPLAHRYAEGRATYATSMLNSATRALRAAGWSLEATEQAGKSVWVRDGMGDAYTSLTPAEQDERDQARSGRVLPAV